MSKVKQTNGNIEATSKRNEVSADGSITAPALSQKNGKGTISKQPGTKKGESRPVKGNDSFPGKEPKYPNQCDYIDEAVDVALAACERYLTADDLDWLFDDLEWCWEDPSRLPENALRIGSCEMYNAGTLGSSGIKRGVDFFVKAAVFLFLTDAIKEVEEFKKKKPITLAKLKKLLEKRLSGHIKPTVEYPFEETN